MSLPTIAKLKLACWNAFNERNEDTLPLDLDFFITDNTKKKLISMVRNDSELAKVSTIGIVWRVSLS